MIAGLGAVTPLGNDVPTFWNGLVAGRPGVEPITACDPTDQRVRFAAEMKEFDAASLVGHQQARRTDRSTQVALVATDQAVADAGLDFGGKGHGLSAAVVLGAALGGITTLLDNADIPRERAGRRVSSINGISHFVYRCTLARYKTTTFFTDYQRLLA